MKALLKLLLCFLLSLGEANEEPVPAEEWTYESNGEVIALNDPEAIAKLQLSEVMRASNGSNLTLTAWSDRFDKIYVGEECCNLSTTSLCARKRGNCIPNNETCYGDQSFGEKYCVISNLKSCKCCVPTECEPWEPCKALNGTCVRIDEECDGSSVSGKQFCNDPKTCKCCFPNKLPDKECPCGQDFDGGCSGYSRQGSKKYNRGHCMKICELGTFPLEDHTCNQTGSEACNCCAPISECLNTTNPNVTFVELGGEYFYIHRIERLNWIQAKAACEADGMRLAEPLEPQLFDLKAYLIENDIGFHYWLGGQGNNAAIVWDSSGYEVYPDSPGVWETGSPGSRITTTYCLDLRTSASSGPLATYGCTNKHNFICECGQVESNKTTTVSVSSTTTASPTQGCVCGQKKVGTRIINGAETVELEYPWMAGLVWTGGSRTWCGGSLINSNWVLTAAHCTIDKTASAIQVILAEHDVTVSEVYNERFNVKQIINNPNYNTNPWVNGHDISLIELDGRVNFETSPARPICLSTGNDSYENELATLTGFGMIGHDQPQSDYLREVDIHVISNSQCSAVYGGSVSNFYTMICAGESDGTGGCMGDSGGPLIYRGNANHYVQIGVVSFGSSQCNNYGVFARVTELMDWIISYTNTGNPDICSPQ